MSTNYEYEQGRESRVAHAILQPRALRYAHITGWGLDLPARRMLNAEFENLVHTNDHWIYSKTGIRERRIAEPGETTTKLAVRAAQKALSAAGIVPSDVDYIVVATSTPEYTFPSTACLVQDLLGATRAGANDVSAACSGFVYALDLAVNKIRTGSIQTALVIGAETMSRVLDWSDRKTCILFGDGAGAVVLQGSDTPGGVLTSTLRSDGSGWDLLTLPSIGSKETYLLDGQHEMHRLYMDGRCVFRFATEALSTGIKTALNDIGLTLDDLDLIIPHQANQRILDAAIQTLDFPPEKVFSNLEKYGNTSAASIPIALVEAIEQGRVRPGDLLGIVGFGGGLSWGSAVIAWTGSETSKPAAALNWGRRREQYWRADVRRVWLHHWRQFVTHPPREKLRHWWKQFKFNKVRRVKTEAAG